MKVQLLGTGSADGWPNPFCVCDSCESQRATGNARASSCALIDNELLIDWGPTLANSASRFGLSLNKVHHILFTHGHADHLAPEFLLWRSWISDLRTLHIYGPPLAISRFEHWLDPDAPVAFHAVQAGDEFTARTVQGDVQVQVLAAAHGHGNGDPFADEAVLYDITGVDGDRLLYATDTGPLQEQTLEAVRDRDFTLVLIEETFGRHHTHDTGHLDLKTLPDTLENLRVVGAVTNATDVVAFHLSHHNPPIAELTLELAEFGARAVDDGTVIDTRTTHAVRTLVIGGARSGKSTFAEALAMNRGRVTYLATGGDRPDDAEWRERVATHQARRPVAWTTVESTDVVGVLRTHAGGTLLIDCISLWLTGVLDESGIWNREVADQHDSLASINIKIDELVAAVQACEVDLIMVSNEAGQGVVPPTYAGRLFRDLLGITNARLAQACSAAYFIVAGRVLPLATVASLLAKDSHE
ncbi:MAG: bifunctional adenosylcobinamide kinase/adenosylcobinamide-phosphate guanylyltransferase [Actinomycetota bacterium]|nr:bifunctional adenosylcobinamide kinase/adenosylcobinamide-phosphate guanylyltransferase [Actinomycetota bacterium]